MTRPDESPQPVVPAGNSPDTPLIHFAGLSHQVEVDEQALTDLSFAIAAGERLVLLGSNGSGKTTLLKVINGLVFASAGHYRYAGREITATSLKDPAFHRRFRREVVLLFQNPDSMLFNPTVFDEIAFGPRQLGVPDLEDRVRHSARLCGVESLLERPPFKLSGGEKQKVCLAALLTLEPRVRPALDRLAGGSASGPARHHPGGHPQPQPGPGTRRPRPSFGRGPSPALRRSRRHLPP